MAGVVTRRPRDIGTVAETAVTRAAQRAGFPQADRRALRGALDGADILLCPGVIIEVKGGEMARDASDLLVESWLSTLAVKRDRLHAVGFLVTQRRHVGILHAERWWAWWRLGWVAELADDGTLPRGPGVSRMGDVVVRCTLGDALTLLRASGYGDPLDELDGGV
jgi:hypothetical protein